MFDITTEHRKKIYAWIQWLSTTIAAVSPILIAVAAVVTTGPLAPVLASAVGVMGVIGGWVGKLAKDHTPVSEFLDAIDSTPGN